MSTQNTRWHLNLILINTSSTKCSTLGLFSVYKKIPSICSMKGKIFPRCTQLLIQASHTCVGHRLWRTDARQGGKSSFDDNNSISSNDVILLLGLLLLGNVEAFDLTRNLLYSSLGFTICIDRLLSIRVSWAQLPDPYSTIFRPWGVWFTTRCKPDAVNWTMMPFVTGCTIQQYSVMSAWQSVTERKKEPIIMDNQNFWKVYNWSTIKPVTWQYCNINTIK